MPSKTPLSTVNGILIVISALSSCIISKAVCYGGHDGTEQVASLFRYRHGEETCLSVLEPRLLTDVVEFPEMKAKRAKCQFQNACKIESTTLHSLTSRHVH